EPYRMLTSRAEHRLVLRHDNADERLTPLGREIGLVTDERYAAFERRVALLQNERERLNETRLSPAEANRRHLTVGATLAELLRRPDVAYSDVADVLAPELGERVEIAVKYEGYIQRQTAAVERMEKLETVAIPPQFGFDRCPGLSREAKEKLVAQRPQTLGQASRIPGVTPADVAVLSVFIHREEMNASAAVHG
ncbi:MAG TPA: hypothetical protein VKR99_00520, partial [Candidatus Eremiobacteraceae bacterium]|nr:hypothetical protein [Candidatus Eremiobacteraceae bacterium]